MINTVKEENGKLVINATYNKEEITKATGKAVNHLALDVTVPGYRKGKAPVEVASKYLRNDAVVNETIHQLFKVLDKELAANTDVNVYFKENKVFSGVRPDANVTKFSTDDAEIVVTYVLRPVVSKLGAYKGITSDAEKRVISDADVEAELKKLAENEAELAPKDKAAENGDTANIDFVGLMNGKEFDGGSAKAFDLVLGSNHFVPGFEEQVVGHKAGDKFDVSLTMPENYPAPLTSKPVVFKVTLNSVKVKEIPEINDDFATTLTGEYASKDLAELKTKIVDHLNKDAEKDYNNHIVNDLLLKVRDASEFVIADSYVDTYVNSRIDEDTHNIENQGLTLDEYLKLVNQDMDAYKASIKDGILAQIKSSLIFEAIYKAENLPAVENKDIEAVIGSPVNDFINGYSKYLKQSKMSDEQISNQINGYLNQIYSSIINDRVTDKLLVLNGYKEETKVEEVKEEAKTEDVKAEDTKAE